VFASAANRIIVVLMPLIENPQCCSSKVPTLVVLKVSACWWL